MELCIQLAIIMVGKQSMNTVLEMLMPKFYKWLNAMKVWKRKKTKSTRKENQRWLRDLKLIEWGPSGLFSEYLEMGRSNHRVKYQNFCEPFCFVSSTVRFRHDICGCVPACTIFRIAQQRLGNEIGCSKAFDILPTPSYTTRTEHWSVVQNIGQHRQIECHHQCKSKTTI